MLADNFVQLLAVAPALHEFHQQAFGRREGAVGGQQPFARVSVDPQSLDQPQPAAQQLVGDEKGFGQQAAAVGRIVKGALQQVMSGVVPRDAGSAAR